jgi:hypothetical protein
MRNSAPGFGVLAAAVTLAIVIQPGCEEVLETCPPCGVVAEGAVNVSGNPALDGNFEALQRILTLAREAEADLDEGLAALAVAVGAPLPDDGRFDAAAVDGLLEALVPAIIDAPGATVAVAVEQGGCRVDTGLALGRQAACERAAGCYVRDDCETGLAGSCTGLCVGDCGTACDGRCFAPTAEVAETCLPTCLGACDGAVAAACPGRCHGACDGACTSHGADGQCGGACDGACSGTCEHDAPFTCDGTCAGYCRVPNPAGSTCGHCRGNCSEGACAGECRGHYRVQGCDQPGRCAGVIACQETGRLLAWAGLRCAPSTAEVRASYSGDFAGDRAGHAAAARLLERVLTRLAGHRAMLGLLVDGSDVTGEVAPAAFTENLLADATAHPEVLALDYLRDDRILCALCVVPDRRHLPLSGLLARLGVLVGAAGDSGFPVTAGAMSCVTPAFEEARELLYDLLPVTDPGLCAACAGDGAADPSALSPDRGAGLYRVVDAIEALLAGLGVAGDDG